jgi:hypothetical protein
MLRTPGCTGYRPEKSRRRLYCFYMQLAVIEPIGIDTLKLSSTSHVPPSFWWVTEIPVPRRPLLRPWPTPLQAQNLA